VLLQQENANKKTTNVSPESATDGDKLPILGDPRVGLRTLGIAGLCSLRN
jgi:hypothetical protein